MMCRHLKTCTAVLALAVVGCQPQPTDRDKLKAEIVMEVMLEVMPLVREQLAAHRLVKNDIEATRAQLRREIEAEVIRKMQMLSPDTHFAVATQPAAAVAVGPAGAVEGYVLRQGEGLPNCKVKLVRMVGARTVMGLLKVFKDGAEFNTVTDEKGKYRFENIPVANYKLKWQLPDDTGWIRRLRYKPDVTVKAGKTHLLKTIETKKRLVRR